MARSSVLYFVCAERQEISDTHLFTPSLHSAWSLVQLVNVSMKKKNRPKRREERTIINHLKGHSVWYLVITSILINILTKCKLFPSLTIRPEVFAESGTNFFYHAYTHDLLTNLTATDAGYLPWIQRILAVSIVKGLHVVALYPSITQWIAIVSIALFSSLFILPVFRKIIASDLCRFFIALAISMVSDYELNAFINFIYFGSSYLFLIMFVEKERMRRSVVLLLGLVSGLIFCSKGAFIVFLPVYVAALIYHFLRKEKTSVLYYAVSTGFGLLQTAVLISNFSSQQSQVSKSLFAFIFYMLKALYYLVLTYRHVLVGSIMTDKGLAPSLLLVVVVLIFALHRIWQQKNTVLLVFFLVGNIIACSSLFLTVLLSRNNINVMPKAATATISVPGIISGSVSRPHILQIDKSIFFVKHFANLRNMFFSNMLIFLVSLSIILPLLPRKSYQLLALAIILYTSGAFAQTAVEEPYRSQSASYSQWRTYSHLLTRDAYCIPINPYPFLLRKNCNYLYPQPTGEYPYQSRGGRQIRLADLSRASDKWQVASFAFVSQQEKGLLDVTAIVRRKTGIIERIRPITPAGYKYTYFLLSTPQTIGSIELRDRQNNSIVVPPNIIVFGTSQ